MLLFSDLHLRPESHTTCYQVLNGVLDHAIATKEETIAFLGDFWHLRYNVPVHLLNMVNDWVSRCQKHGKKLILLPGNHDQVDELGGNALEVFDRPNVEVYSAPGINEHGAWMPYRRPEYVAQHIKELRDAVSDASAPNVLFAHLPLKGAFMNNMKMDEHGLPLSIFKGWKKIFLGHYHKQQDFMNGAAHYIGSPWQTRADEAGQPKGFAIWDGSKFERVNTDWGPKFYKLEFQDGMEVPGKEGDTIRLSVPEVTDDLKQWAINHPANVILEDTAQKVVQPRFAFSEGTTLPEYVAQYMKDKKPKELDEKVLWSQWDELTS